MWALCRRAGPPAGRRQVIFWEEAILSVLIVVAHPDDEVLGPGGTMSAMRDKLGAVTSCILVGDADARTRRPRSEELYSNILRASDLLGMQPPILGSFPNIRLNTIAHLELVQFIEEAISAVNATTIFTHHPGDLNNDHVQVSRACQAAARLSQRRSDIPPLEALYFMEILSSTEWYVPGGSMPFEPDTFVEIGEEGLARKVEALSAYRGVMRDYPHPRSAEALRGLAAYRGAQAGLQLAEAFRTGFRRLAQSAPEV